MPVVSSRYLLLLGAAEHDLRVEARSPGDVGERKTERGGILGLALTGSHDRRRRDRQQHDEAATSARHRRILAPPIAASGAGSSTDHWLSGGTQIRRQAARAGELGLRFRNIAAPPQGETKLIVRLRVLRIEADGLAKPGDGVGQLVLPETLEPGVHREDRRLGIRLDLAQSRGVGKRLRGARTVMGRGQRLSE